MCEVHSGRFSSTARRGKSTDPIVHFSQFSQSGFFTVDGYALAVCDELRRALKGLVER